ncbi:MAG TPA: hypothetical protein VF433_15230 [Cellvibrio sp.]
MKFELNAKDGIEQKPTFIQFCKDSIGKKLPNRFYVQKIWLPNKYPSATLETESFRVRISSKSHTWQTISEEMPSWVISKFALAITEVSTDSYDYSLEVVETEECIWTPLGEFGMELEIQDQPKRKRKPLA